MHDIAREAIEKAAHGDMHAFEDIYRSMSSAVYSIALGITRNRQDAEDAAQETFIRIFRNIKNFRFGSSFGTWVYRIAVNTAINKYHQRSRRAAVTLNIEDASGLPAPAGSEARAAIDKADANLKVAALLAGLSPEHRAVIIMREMEGLDYREIADTIGVPINTVRSRLKRAREAMVSAVGRGGRSS